MLYLISDIQYVYHAKNKNIISFLGMCKSSTLYSKIYCPELILLLLDRDTRQTENISNAVQYHQVPNVTMIKLKMSDKICHLILSEVSNGHVLTLFQKIGNYLDSIATLYDTRSSSCRPFLANTEPGVAPDPPDARRSVGGRDHAKVCHITALAEVARWYGAKAKDKGGSVGFLIDYH